MVTIQDVAKAAGVSPMTVSHVINEHRHVKESTRAKVLATMSDLGYRVNVAARNLRTGRTGTIGLAVPEVDRPYWGQLGAAIIVGGGTTWPAGGDRANRSPTRRGAQRAEHVAESAV